MSIQKRLKLEGLEFEGSLDYIRISSFILIVFERRGERRRERKRKREREETEGERERERWRERGREK